MTVDEPNQVLYLNVASLSRIKILDKKAFIFQGFKVKIVLYFDEPVFLGFFEGCH